MLKKIKTIIYRLKRDYGITITIKRVLSTTHNLKTGVVERDFSEEKVKRAIVLPARLIQKFTYDIAYLAANKNFTYGGFYDIQQKVIILDKKDVKTEITKKDYIIIEENNIDKRYLIKEINPLEGDQGYLLIVKSTKDE